MTTFETDLLAVTGARLSTLVTAGRRAAEARTGTTTDTLTSLGGSVGRFECMQFHDVVRVIYSTTVTRW